MSREAVVALIQSATTTTGLRVRAKLDKRTYEVGKNVSADAVKRVRLTPHRFHGEWNYAVRRSKTER